MTPIRNPDLWDCPARRSWGQWREIRPQSDLLQCCLNSNRISDNLQLSRNERLTIRDPIR